ncbi:DoxX family protein [Marmoricola sp. Leaf446]|uniref:DoxX family protein n=1 Tax=Marmoricola sp. Leaf446 TaxID=1736379 RepID=UPI000AFEEAFA|nr:DoxX family protein [Marmoricola sp. Leaf446]
MTHLGPLLTGPTHRRDRGRPDPGVLGLAAAFASSGVVHLVRPQTFEPMVLRVLPAHRGIVYVSGVAELVCAAGLLHPRTRPAAGWASAALLLAVYPANLKMAGDARRSDSTAVKAAAWARLPLQLPPLRVALRAARAGRPVR